VWPMILIGVSVLQALTGSFLFARVVLTPTTAQVDRLVGLSVLWWIFALVVGLVSVYLETR